MRALTSVLVCGLALTLVGCSDSHDKVAADSLAVMSEMNDILDGVTDKPSAEAAAPKLESLGKRMQDIKARQDKLGKPSADQQAALEQKYQEQMGKEMMRLFGNAMRVGTNPEISAVLDDAMQDLEPPQMEGAGGGGMEFLEDMPQEAGGSDPFNTQNPFGSEDNGPALPAEPMPEPEPQ